MERTFNCQLGAAFCYTSSISGANCICGCILNECLLKASELIVSTGVIEDSNSFSQQKKNRGEAKQAIGVQTEHLNDEAGYAVDIVLSIVDVIFDVDAVFKPTKQKCQIS